jgi:hypothetical protein
MSKSKAKAKPKSKAKKNPPQIPHSITRQLESAKVKAYQLGMLRTLESIHAWLREEAIKWFFGKDGVPQAVSSMIAIHTRALRDAVEDRIKRLQAHPAEDHEQKSEP